MTQGVDPITDPFHLQLRDTLEAHLIGKCSVGTCALVFTRILTYLSVGGDLGSEADVSDYEDSLTSPSRWNFRWAWRKFQDAVAERPIPGVTVARLSARVSGRPKLGTTAVDRVPGAVWNAVARLGAEGGIPYRSLAATKWSNVRLNGAKVGARFQFAPGGRYLVDHVLKDGQVVSRPLGTKLEAYLVALADWSCGGEVEYPAATYPDYEVGGFLVNAIEHVRLVFPDVPLFPVRPKCRIPWSAEPVRLYAIEHGIVEGRAVADEAEEIPALTC